ncbi:hypothetical protein ID866_3418 [Astraeus odoratus]|nr:hypothetical protein ID866_3418 [Astraeus odoratus]
MVSRVVIGRPYKRYYNAPGFTSPPDGYDSVAGEIGWALNYEETVTYHNDTIRPAYLVVYGKEKDPPLTGKEFLASMFKTPLAS